MSTRAMCPDTDTLVSYLYDEYDGGELFDRREVEQHLDTCETCAAEVAALGGVRQQLREWSAPENTPLGFRVVREPAVKRHWWAGHHVSFPLAAAAALVLGVGLGVARLDVQYDAQGFRIRTGWGHDDGVGAGVVATNGGVNQTGVGQSGGAFAGRTVGMSAIDASAAHAMSSAALGLTASAPASGTTSGVPSLVAPSPVAPWRAEIAALERQLRQEMAVMRQAEAARAGGQVQAASLVAGGVNGGAGQATDQALVQRIQQMIDQSEVRQQQNLALRMAEMGRDFEVQRRSDLVRVEQGFGRLNDQREQDATQQRLLLNAIRVSQQRPPQ